jgi:glycine/D-amino acid oxidase-like deaminating enzyme
VNLILGQGIAGSVLAIRLLQRGEAVIVVDDGYLSSSSMVAAGLWNPIVFRRINKSWMADEFSAELENFYPQMEEMLNARFYHSKSIRRMHSSAFESNLWKEKILDAEYSRYLEDNQAFNPESFYISETPYGNGTVMHSGHLNLPAFLAASRLFFEERGCYFNETICLPETKKELDVFEFNGMRPKRIIDCRGCKSAQDSLFSWLPFGLTKGELLTVRCRGLFLKDIFNAGFFLCPLGADVYRLGATFDWNDINEIPTEKGRDELLQKFSKWFDVNVEIIDHKAGIRPTVQDRRPLIGKHPDFTNMYIFNGLGTKGVMIAPWLSNHFCDNLLENTELLPEVNIDRFAHLIGEKRPLINYPHP